MAVASVLLCTVGCDQAMKQFARVQLGHRPANLGFVQFILSENPGGFLSLGGRLPENVRLGILVVGVCVGLAALLVYLLRAAHLKGVMFFGLALLLAGGVSNLIDRCFCKGLVTDFIYVQIGPLHTGIFNVADMAIVLGIALVLFSAWRHPDSKRALQAPKD
jgi:signal peptidase II